jgi:peptide/nickel transport system substrate-binding protein
MADWESPDSLDPIHATTANDLRVAGLLFAPLWGRDPDLRAYPDLVREVPRAANRDLKLGPDGVTMTVDLKLAPGLRWSDGEPITADDVIFTVDAICAAGLPGRDQSGFDHIASQERRSDSEVIWHFGPGPRGRCGLGADLASGVYPALEILGPRARLLPKHRLGSIPFASWPSQPFFKRPNVSSGPFVLKDAVGDQLLHFAANPHYADGRSRAPYLDAIDYRFYNGKAAMIAGLRAGESDLGFHLQPEDLDQLRGIPSSDSLTWPTLQGEYLNPNHAANTLTGRAPPWVGDAPVLQALSEALDRQALNDAAFGRAAAITPGLYPVLMRSFADPSPAPPPRALADARKVLEGDGWKPGSDSVRVKAGRRLEFTLLAPCDSAPRQVEQAALVKQWAELGAQVTAACRPRAEFFAAYPQKGANAAGRFDVSLYSNTWEPDPSAWAPFGESSQIPSTSNPSGLNWNRCQDPAIDRAFAAGRATLDFGQRRQAYLDAAAAWLRYGCTIPLFDWPEVVQRTGKLHNFTPNAGSVDTWNAADWWLSG